ncbi:MAG: hypothetical protein WCK63_17385, partial [Betaproteobacteria bacterium]
AKMSKSTPLLALMHDTAHPLNNSIAVAKLIKKELTCDCDKDNTISMYLDLIIKEQENCKHMLDAYYVEMNKLLNQ